MTRVSLTCQFMVMRCSVLLLTAAVLAGAAVAEQPASSWVAVSEIIGKIKNGTSGTVSLASNFKCNYTKGISIFGEVTLHGNNATCDAGGHGRFFSVAGGATFRLDWIKLKGGEPHGDVSGLFSFVLCIRSSVAMVVCC